MGRRNRQRQRQADAGPPGKLAAPTSTYVDPEAGELELRGSLSPAARRQYAQTLSGGLDQEDAWQRATELLFERLAVSWTIAGLRLDRQRELIGRYRMAGAQERRFVRDSLRAHLTEHFPEMKAP
ncbi:MAG TPA: hypothetical protein VG405_07105 [Solirubrobacteraceae bacterium]|jgi:hypothetical protein|nr:hypothetical protein [Solirubrobacteraceae bacterium]